MNFLRQTLLAVATAGVLTASVSVSAQTALNTDKEKVSYMVGMQIGGSLASIQEEIDMKIVFAAIESAMAGKEPLLTPEQAMEVQRGFAERMQGKQAAEMQKMAVKNKAEGEAFLAKNRSASGVKTTDSGLQYQVVTPGSGAKPAATDTVRVHYVGTLLDGTKFDSSIDRGEPAQFALNAVIPGWTEALQLMPVGSKYKLWIPSELGYGDRGTPGPIGPNTTLAFEVELLEIVK
jgi:FKBP-type peptidyl-prolyl cis-trans isomerase FkpA